ncbi:MAG: AAA family ATPase [Patescibacteria group bacterium]|jgi:chromosome partitioning protein|nr:AAA family ATPase [Patescibacteria group bacterium]
MLNKKIISLVNQKGGVGKTTSVINIGFSLASLRHKVLIIDLDAQGNASSGIGVTKQDIEYSSYDFIMGSVDVNKCIYSTRKEGLSIIYASSNLSGAEIELVNSKNREFFLKERLENLNYDYILIDCPPSLGLLTVNALTASNYIIIPVQAEYYALEGLSQLLETFKAVKNSINPDLSILGVILTMYDKRTTLGNQILDEINKYFGDLTFNTKIPRNIRLAEAPSFGLSIYEHDKWSKGARAYKALSKEIEQRLDHLNK